MKYWVYKDSRILGPFDKQGVASLPGLDSGTLVCVGDPDRGEAWKSIDEHPDLAGMLPPSAAPSLPDFPSASALLDRLQIEVAGLIEDDDFPGLAEDLFADADIKRGLAGALSPGATAEEEARRARERAADLAARLEAMAKRLAELELANAELTRRLGQAAPVVSAPASTSVPPPTAAEVPPAAPSGWNAAPAAGTEAFPAFGAAAVPPAATAPAPVAALPGAPVLPPAPVAPPALPPMAAAPPLPEIPAFGAGAPPAREVLSPLPAGEKPKTLSFGKPKQFKVAPTIKSFKVVGGADPAAVAPPSPAAEPSPTATAPPAFAALPSAQIPPPAVVPPAAQVSPPIEPLPSVSSPVPAPAAAEPPAPVEIQPISPPPPPLEPAAPEPVAVADLVAPAPAPAPVPTFTDLMSPATPTPAPPQTLTRSASAAPAASIEADVASRFAKPEPPATAAPKKPARSNKPFLFAGTALVVLLAVVGVIFLRQPKDLKQMATLDDGKAPIGLPALDDGSAPPAAKPERPKPSPVAAAPEPAPAPAAQSESSTRNAELEAAVELVKNFPLDGGRGTVGRWLQYSYTASPDAGPEEWLPSSTADGVVLVEYRVAPAPGRQVSYLFEVDTRLGIVIGKSLEARQMLAGSPPPAEKPKAKTKPKTKSPVKARPRPRPAAEPEKEIPLLPLPDAGELRPPAEDDGSFGADTIGSGL